MNKRAEEGDASYVGKWLLKYGIWIVVFIILFLAVAGIIKFFYAMA